MLDTPLLHQATGLMQLGTQHGPKLLAVVSHGDEHAELPLLLRLCTNLVELGYPVVVLDGSAMENKDNPGLEQALQGVGAGWATLDAPAWKIAPAGLGLLNLAARNRGVLGWNGLHALFGSQTVVIVYSTATVLSPLFTGSDMRPVIALSRAKTSLLTSYVALKRILTKAHLQPLVVHVNQDNNAARQHASHNATDPVTGLQEHTRQFLQYDFSAVELTIADADDSRADKDIQRLALGLLETAHAITNGHQEQQPWLKPLVQMPAVSSHPAVPVSTSIGRH